MNQGYDNNSQQQYYYRRSEPPRKNNTALIVAVSILATLLVVAIICGIVYFSGQRPVGNGNLAPNPTTAGTETPPSPPTPATPAAEVPVANMYVANVPNSAYFRSEPYESQGNIICEVPRRTMVGFIKNETNVFAKVQYNGRTGYIKSEYLSNSDPGPYVDNSNKTVIRYMYVANVPNSIYLRSSASENSSNVITTIPLGRQVGFIEMANSIFAKVNYKGTIGYVKYEYLSNYAPSTYTTYMTVCNVPHSIYLRSSASEASKSNIICEIPVGSTVEYISTPNSTFHKIRWNGMVGYAKQEYLR